MRVGDFICFIHTRNCNCAPGKNMWRGGGTPLFLTFVVLFTSAILQVKGYDIYSSIKNLESNKSAPAFLRKNAMNWYYKTWRYDRLDRKPYYFKGMSNPSTVGVDKEELSDEDCKDLSDTFRMDLESLFRKAQMYDHYKLEESRYRDVYWEIFALSFKMDGVEDYQDAVQEWYDKAQLYDQSKEKLFYYEGMEDPSTVGVTDEELDWDIGLSDDMMEIIENWFIKAQIYDFKKSEAKKYKEFLEDLQDNDGISKDHITEAKKWYSKALMYDQLKYKPLYFKGMEIKKENFDWAESLYLSEKYYLETYFMKAQLYDYYNSEAKKYKDIVKKLKDLESKGLSDNIRKDAKNWYSKAQKYDELKWKPLYFKGMQEPYTVGVIQETLKWNITLPDGYKNVLENWFRKVQMYAFYKSEAKIYEEATKEKHNLPGNLRNDIKNWYSKALKYDQLKIKPLYFEGMKSPGIVGVTKENFNELSKISPKEAQPSILNWFRKAQMYDYYESEASTYTYLNKLVDFWFEYKTDFNKGDLKGWYNKSKMYDQLEMKPLYYKGMKNPDTIGVTKEKLNWKADEPSSKHRKIVESWYRKAQMYNYYESEAKKHTEILKKLKELEIKKKLSDDYAEDATEWYYIAKLYDQLEKKPVYKKGMKNPQSVGVKKVKLDWNIGLSSSMMKSVEGWFIKAQMYDYQKAKEKKNTVLDVYSEVFDNYQHHNYFDDMVHAPHPRYPHPPPTYAHPPHNPASSYTSPTPSYSPLSPIFMPKTYGYSRSGNSRLSTANHRLIMLKLGMCG